MTDDLLKRLAVQRDHNASPGVAALFGEAIREIELLKDIDAAFPTTDEKLDEFEREMGPFPPLTEEEVSRLFDRFKWTLVQENDALRKIAAHVPGDVWIKAKEASGFATKVVPAPMHTDAPAREEPCGTPDIVEALDSATPGAHVTASRGDPARVGVLKRWSWTCRCGAKSERTDMTIKESMADAAQHVVAMCGTCGGDGLVCSRWEASVEKADRYPVRCMHSGCKVPCPACRGGA